MRLGYFGFSALRNGLPFLTTKVFSVFFRSINAATIGLRFDEASTPERVRLKSTERSPFPFTLDVVLTGSNGATQAYQVFEADLNPFIKRMVESPLKNLFDHIADRMVAIHA